MREERLQKAREYKKRQYELTKSDPVAYAKHLETQGKNSLRRYYSKKSIEENEPHLKEERLKKDREYRARWLSGVKADPEKYAKLLENNKKCKKRKYEQMKLDPEAHRKYLETSAKKYEQTKLDHVAYEKHRETSRKNMAKMAHRKKMLKNNAKTETTA